MVFDRGGREVYEIKLDGHQEAFLQGATGSSPEWVDVIPSRICQKNSLLNSML